MKVVSYFPFILLIGCGGSDENNSPNTTESQPSQSIEQYNILITDNIQIGDNGDNTLDAGDGINYLIGSYGNDTYVINQGDGLVTISEFDDELGVLAPPASIDNAEGTGFDTLAFGAGIYREDLVPYLDGSRDLVIKISGSTDQITIKNWYYDDSTAIEFITFEDDLPLETTVISFGDSILHFSNWLSGDATNNQLAGYEGDDILSGQGGDDIIDGGEGNDHLYGGLGADYLIGGSGKDTVYYLKSKTGVNIALDNSFYSTGDIADGDSFDSLEDAYGSEFDDQIFGTSFNNTLHGLNGDDLINGLDGSDEIEGGKGNDTIYGGTGEDYLYGNEGNDIIYGGEGQDYLVGNDGDDELYGDEFDDKIEGGPGDDTLSGGAGQDLYYFGLNFGLDTILYDTTTYEANYLIFLNYDFSDLWLHMDSNDLIIEALDSQDKIVVIEYEKSNFQIVYTQESSVTNHDSDTVDNYIFKDATDALIQEMVKYSKPNNSSEFQEELLQYIKKISIKATKKQIDTFKNSLSDKYQTLNEDETYSGNYISDALIEEFPDQEFIIEETLDCPYGKLDLDTSTGEYTFTPNEDFSGQCYFELSIQTESGLKGNFISRFRVNPVDDPAVFSPYITIKTDEDVAVESDIGFLDDDNILGDYDIQATSSLGKLEFNSLYATLKFIPFQNLNGHELVDATFTDREGRNTIITIDITVNPINHYPDSSKTINATVISNSEKITIGKIYVFDVDSEDTYSFNITKTGTGDLSIDDTGVLTYKPAENFIGEDNFTVRAIDSSGDPESYSDTEVNIIVQ